MIEEVVIVKKPAAAKRLLVVPALLGASFLATVVFMESYSSGNAQTKARYLPEYTQSGELILPKNWRNWVFVGAPLTPNALNEGQAIFLNITTSTSSRDRTRSTRKRTNFPKGPSFSRSCSSRCPATSPMAHARRLRGADISPVPIAAPT